jgi:hypothetical protein
MSKIKLGTFNNLPNFYILSLENNQIRKLQPNSYYGLSHSFQIKI